MKAIQYIALCVIKVYLLFMSWAAKATVSRRLFATSMASFLGCLVIFCFATLVHGILNNYFIVVVLMLTLLWIIARRVGRRKTYWKLAIACGVAGSAVAEMVCETIAALISHYMPLVALIAFIALNIAITLKE